MSERIASPFLYTQMLGTLEMSLFGIFLFVFLSDVVVSNEAKFCFLPMANLSEIEVASTIESYQRIIRKNHIVNKFPRLCFVNLKNPTFFKTQKRLLYSSKRIGAKFASNSNPNSNLWLFNFHSLNFYELITKPYLKFPKTSFEIKLY